MAESASIAGTRRRALAICRNSRSGIGASFVDFEPLARTCCRTARPANVFRRAHAADPRVPAHRADRSRPARMRCCRMDWPGRARGGADEGAVCEVAEAIGATLCMSARKRNRRAAEARAGILSALRPITREANTSIRVEAAKTNALTHRWRSHDSSIFGKRSQQRVDGNFAFDPRQRHADTRMDAAREREVMVRRAFDVEAFRLVRTAPRRDSRRRCTA